MLIRRWIRYQARKRYLLRCELRNVKLNLKRLVAELEKFNRGERGGLLWLEQDINFWVKRAHRIAWKLKIPQVE